MGDKLENLYYLIDDSFQKPFYRRVIENEEQVNKFFKELEYKNVIATVKSKRGKKHKIDIISAYKKTYDNAP